MDSPRPIPEPDTESRGGNDPTPESDLGNRHARRSAKKRGRLAARAETRAAATAEADEARAIAAIRVAAALNRKFYSGGL